MKPIDFPQANFTFTRPVGTTAEQCGDLRVFKGAYADGRPVSISCFEVDDAELEEIVRTRRVWLHVGGTAHPPVALDGRSPWQEGE